jgi:hypothetical protein
LVLGFWGFGVLGIKLYPQPNIFVEKPLPLYSEKGKISFDEKNAYRELSFGEFYSPDDSTLKKKRIVNARNNNDTTMSATPNPSRTETGFQKGLISGLVSTVPEMPNIEIPTTKKNIPNTR